MGTVTRFAIVFAALVLSRIASAGDFSDPFNRVKEVWENVSSFHDKAWQAINDTLSSASTDQVDRVQQNFWNNTAPREITDASKIAIKQIFPGVADAIDNADKVDNVASKWASQAQDNARANLDALGQKVTDLKNQLSDYLGGSASALPQVPQSTPPAAAPSSLTSADLASIGASNTGGAAAPTSLASDAQQLPGQLSSWDQQQAAIAAERERQRQLELQRLQQQAAAEERARQQRELQAAQTYIQSQPGAQGNSEYSGQANNTEPSSSSASQWGSFVMGMIQQRAAGRQGTRAPAQTGNADKWFNSPKSSSACTSRGDGPSGCMGHN